VIFDLTGDGDEDALSGRRRTIVFLDRMALGHTFSRIFLPVEFQQLRSYAPVAQRPPLPLPSSSLLTILLHRGSDSAHTLIRTNSL
jgi:hypothetical protein